MTHPEMSVIADLEDASEKNLELNGVCPECGCTLSANERLTVLRCDAECGWTWEAE